MHRGPKKKPTALKVIERGTPEQVEAMLAKIPPDMPRPPTFLDAYALHEWNEIAPMLYSQGILTELDRQAMAGWCVACSRWRRAEELLKAAADSDAEKLGGMVATTDAGNKVQSVLLTVANGAMRDMLRFAAEFGMTPAARARIEGKRGDAPPDTIQRKYFKR